jgi:uncharacterized protein YndB with AHSA1/START domain
MECLDNSERDQAVECGVPDDWHTTVATVDLREGGAFSSRMEAKDGSSGFDFEGIYSKVIQE